MSYALAFAATVMKIPRLVAISLLVFGSFAATGVTPTKTELETMYDKAFREFDANHYDEALKALDAIDARQPDLAESQNLRGVVLLRKGDQEKADPALSKAYFDKAEKALHKALELEPKFWNAQFNLSEIPFLKKDWTEARNRFEALIAGNSDEMKGETSLLIQYKILLTFVLQGKENMVDWILNKFEGEKDSPALYYSNAAIALQKNNQKEADDWMKAAQKHYPASLNKLFAESFYEVGWMTKPEGETRAAIEITSTSERAARMKADSQANFERAERSFRQRDFPAAVKFLDLADEGAPNQAPSLNLRGEIAMEDQKFDEAEEAFRQANVANPKFREAQYNLAQIPFKKKDYAKSRERLEKLFADTPGGEKNQAAQLIKYKIFMTLLLEGNDAQAQQMMDQFKFTGDTPALYYAQAAWSFKHDNRDQGNDWIKSARKIYSPALNIIFADTFYDLGWLERAPETAPTTTALAQANAAPAGPKPAMRFGESESLPAPVPLTEQPATTPAITVASAATSPAAVQTAAGPVAIDTAAATAASSPAPVLAKSTPAPAVASSPATVVAKSTPAPVIASSPIVVAKALPVPARTVAQAPISTPARVTASAALTPAATALAPARIREWSQPTFAEMMDRAADPRTLLFGGLLLGGLVILGWLIVQQLRRGVAGGAPIYESSMPLTEPRFRGAGGSSNDERRVGRENLDASPPKLSLQLKGSEPAVRKAVLPSGAVGTRAATSDLAGQGTVPPNERSKTVSEVRPAVAKASEPIAAKPNESKTPPPVTKTPEPALAKTNEPKTPPPVTPKTSVEPPKAPLRDDREVSVAAKPKPSFLPWAVPAKAAATPRPAIVSEPRAPVAEPKKVPVVAEVKPPVAPPAQPPVRREEPIGQGQPVPSLQSAPPVPPLAAPVVAAQSIAPASKPAPAPVAKIEPAKVEPPKTELPKTDVISKPDEQRPVRIEPEAAAIAAIAGTRAKPQSSVETPSIASKILLRKLTTPPSTTPAIMPEPTPITAINEPRPTPAAGGAEGAPMPVAQPGGALQTAVQLTFSLEIASLQLTPNFKMGSLQLKPISKIVSMRLAPSSQPQPAMNLQVTFELSSVQGAAGSGFGTVRLTPSSAQRPTPLTTPSFEISGLQLVSGSAASPVQLTPTAQGAASVLMTASFQIATVEFSPSFEIASVVLNGTSKNVAVQLPGAGPSSIEGAPVFEIDNVQLSGNNEIGLIQLNPLGGAGRR